MLMVWAAFVLAKADPLLEGRRQCLQQAINCRPQERSQVFRQDELAKLAGLNTSTISGMEAKAAGVLTSGMDTVHRVVRALEAVGVQATNFDGRLGVEMYAAR
jgi:hypothetical protein